MRKQFVFVSVKKSLPAKACVVMLKKRSEICFVSAASLIRIAFSWIASSNKSCSFSLWMCVAQYQMTRKYPARVFCFHSVLVVSTTRRLVLAALTSRHYAHWVAEKPQIKLMLRLECIISSLKFRRRCRKSIEKE